MEPVLAYIKLPFMHKLEEDAKEAFAEVKDELIRVARNPLIKFNKSERFHAPLDLLLKNSSNIETFQSVFQILLNEDLDDIDGFKEFKKLFQNGIEEFFTDFWNVDSDLEIYLSKLK